MAASTWFYGILLAFGAAESGLAKSYVEGSDQFEVSYSYTIPALASGETAEVWLPLARSDVFQTVSKRWTAPGLKLEVTAEAEFGNRFLHTKVGPSDAGKTVSVDYRVQRQEKAAYAAGAELKNPAYLRSEPLMPLNDRFKTLAAEITKGKDGDLAKGRAIYDYVMKEMKYDKTGTGWGRGDAVYACDTKTGNCTDFHALFIVLARSSGLPARFAIGFSLPEGVAQGSLEGYHCWAEFAAAGKWVPVDISEGWKDPSAKDYYFGHHPANRFELSTGEQLTLQPPAHEGPLTFLVHPYVEVNGKVLKGSKGVYSFKRTTPAAKTYGRGDLVPAVAPQSKG